MPQNFALIPATVAGPAVSDPLAAVPTSPSSYGLVGGPAGLGTQSLGRLEAVNTTLLDARVAFSDRLPLDPSTEPLVWASVA